MATRNYIPAYNAMHVDGTLAAQCEMFVLLYAVPTINGEVATTTNHAARQTWASAMLTDTAALARAVVRLKVQMVQNATIVTAVGAGTPAQDSDVEFVGSQYLPTLVSLGA